MMPLHEAHDTEKVAALAASMERDGWIGAPLVVWGECLLTGSHRYAAAMSLGWQHTDIPTVAVEDVFAEAGLDFDAICQDEDCDGIASPMLPYVLGADYLPADVRERYGLDLR